MLENHLCSCESMENTKKIKKEKIVIVRIMTNVRIKVKRISDSIYTETTKNKHGT